jgi:hypothetical protein
MSTSFAMDMVFLCMLNQLADVLWLHLQIVPDQQGFFRKLAEQLHQRKHPFWQCALQKLQNGLGKGRPLQSAGQDVQKWAAIPCRRPDIPCDHCDR